jgi:hypothetical protein
MQPEDVKQRLQKYMLEYDNITAITGISDADGSVDQLVTSGKCGAVIGVFETMARKSGVRRLIFGYLLRDGGELHARDITKREWYALHKWIGFIKIDNTWVVSEEFTRQFALVMTRAIREEESRLMQSSPSLKLAIEELGGELVDVVDDNNGVDNSSSRRATDSPISRATKPSSSFLL